MKKYMLIYYGSRPEDMKEEDVKARMQEWMAWFESMKDSVVDMGSMLHSGMSVSYDSSETIAKDMWPATGTTTIQAENMDEAVKLAQGCPDLKHDSETRVRVYEAPDK